MKNAGWFSEEARKPGLTLKIQTNDGACLISTSFCIHRSSYLQFFLDYRGKKPSVLVLKDSLRSLHSC